MHSGEQGREPYALLFEPTHRMAALQADHADLPKGEERDCTCGRGRPSDDPPGDGQARLLHPGG